VITSKDGKTYDTAEDSERQSGLEERRALTDGEGAKARWADDGGGPLTLPSPVVFADKPAWSVQSVQALNESIRRANDPHDAARLRQESERRDRESVRVAAVRDDMAARVRNAERNRYRNPWENT
jgi:hypothetical protein